MLQLRNQNSLVMLLIQPSKITKLIKFLPRREGIFNGMRETLQIVSNIRLLCTTWWTVRAEALSSKIMPHYWIHAVDAVKDSLPKAGILGVASQMKSFEYVFGNLLGQLVLDLADNLSVAIQHRHHFSWGTENCTYDGRDPAKFMEWRKFDLL